MIQSHQPNQQPRVPVLSCTGQPLMPCRPVRARKFVQQGRAIKCWTKGFFYIQMLDITEELTQLTVVGVDPGSKREAYTVKSEHTTFLNLQSHASDGKAIKKSLETRANVRRTRRSRRTPCRAPRFLNRGRKNWLPPSTKARWQLKLNIIKHLLFLYPISVVIIEDIKATTKKGKYRWNNSFSPVQTGKNWLYSQLEALDLQVIKIEGYQTHQLRQNACLHKSSNKLATTFDAHCVDSWVLANYYTGGHIVPDSINMLLLKPLSYSRRQLHVFNPSNGNIRKRYGGTMSLGIKKGTLVRHPKHGKCLVGGYLKEDQLSLHSPGTLSRLCQNANPSDLTKIAYSPWVVSGHYNLSPSVKLERRIARRNRASLCSRLGERNSLHPKLINPPTYKLVISS